jgi:trans-aconitate methyltransferase
MPVNWLRRAERAETTAAPAPEGSVPGRVERVMPGIAAALEQVSHDRSHAVLDLGSASDSSLRVYSQFARWVRFADLLSATETEAEWTGAVDAIPAQPQRPYDLVFAWNVLDWIEPPQRQRLVARLAELTAPDARLHVIVDAGRDGYRHPLRFSLLDVDRMCYQHAGHPLPAGKALLPAELERVVEPFRVTRAFTTQVGLREYVGVRRGR